MENKELVKEFLKKGNVFAVVGASRNPEKYGSRVYLDLKKAGYRVFPVNSRADNIFGDKCYPDLKSLPVKPDVVDLVVPPEVTERIVRSCRELDIKRVWMQPGSESEEAISYCRKNGIDVLHGLCVMVQIASGSGRASNQP